MNVLILCGGRSAERDVSCVSAAAILRRLSPRHRPLLVRIGVDGRWRLRDDPARFASHKEPWRLPQDGALARLELGGPPRLRAGSRLLPVGVAIPALHGPFGEDGTVQGLLELAGVPYVGCGVLASAAGMDKVTTKRLAREAGLPLLPYAVIEEPGDLGAARRLAAKPPVFVKPARLGSSVGVYKVDSPGALAGAVRAALRFDTTVIVEKGVSAREIECAVLGDGSRAEASVVGEIRPRAEFYSYEAKYLDPRGAELVVPAEIPAPLARAVQRMSKKAFGMIGGHGLARVDFLLDRRTGRAWFNEINTFPGFTAVSMYPRLWEASGIPFSSLVARLIGLALERHRRRSRLRLTRD